MNARAFSFRLTLNEAGPVYDADFQRATPVERAMVLNWLVLYGLREKDVDLAEGLDAHGAPLIPVLPATAKHRHSAMGPADPAAAALMPAHAVSRTRLLLTGEAGPDYAEYWWLYDSNTGDSWGQVLDYHRQGIGSRHTKRDVIGISPQAVARVRTAVAAKWAAYKRGVVTGRVDPAQPTPPPPRFRVIGKTDFEQFTYGIGGSGPAESRKALNAGYNTGFFQRKPGQGLPALGGPGTFGRPPGPRGRPPQPPRVGRGPRPPAPKPVAPKAAPAPAPVRGVAAPQDYQAIRTRVAGLKTAEEKQAAVAEWVRERATQAPEPKRVHGMTTPEDLVRLDVGGVRYYFPPVAPAASAAEAAAAAAKADRAGAAGYRAMQLGSDVRAAERLQEQVDAKYPRTKPGPVAQQYAERQARIDAMKAEAAVLRAERDAIRGELQAKSTYNPFVDTLAKIAEGRELPAPLVASTKEVVFSSQRNSTDSYWEKTYNTPSFVAHATGGDGSIAVYNSRGVGPGTVVHEMAHNFATVKYGSIKPPPGSDYSKAAESPKEPPPTPYAANSIAEDFAESVRLFYEDPDTLRSIAPLRFDVIEQLLRNTGYGG